MTLVLAAITAPAIADETRQLPPGGVSPPATIDQLAWLIRDAGKAEENSFRYTGVKR